MLNIEARIINNNTFFIGVRFLISCICFQTIYVAKISKQNNITKYFYRKFIFKVPESRKTKTGIKDIFCKTKRFFGEFID